MSTRAIDNNNEKQKKHSNYLNVCVALAADVIHVGTYYVYIQLYVGRSETKTQKSPPFSRGHVVDGDRENTKAVSSRGFRRQWKYEDVLIKKNK